MAKNPQKSSDPASDALAAIEDALRVRDQNSVPPVLPDSRRMASGPAEELFEDTEAAPTLPWAHYAPGKRNLHLSRPELFGLVLGLNYRPAGAAFLRAG